MLNNIKVVDGSLKRFFGLLTYCRTLQKKGACEEPCVWGEDTEKPGRFHCTGPEGDGPEGVTATTMLQLAECAQERGLELPKFWTDTLTEDGEGEKNAEDEDEDDEEEDDEVNEEL